MLLTLKSPSRFIAPLPRPRGELSAFLLEILPQGPCRLPRAPQFDGDALDDDDFQLALHCCYELHYRGLHGVDPEWEWEPSLLAWRAVLEAAFEEALRDELAWAPSAKDDVVDGLWTLATAGGGPSLSGWALDHGSVAHAQEFAVHRSGYQLKEADAHTWCIPRLSGRAKAAMVTIQADEYGQGDAAAMHASLFADTMSALGLISAYGHYVDDLPAPTLATDNLVSYFGLHRRWRGALVGHLALFEMTSVGPMARYGSWLQRLGISERGRRFYDAHVAADEEHQHIAANDLAGGLVEDEPDLAGDVLWGAGVLSAVERRFSNRLLTCWQGGRSSLYEAWAESPGPAGDQGRAKAKIPTPL